MIMFLFMAIGNNDVYVLLCCKLCMRHTTLALKTDVIRFVDKLKNQPSCVSAVFSKRTSIFNCFFFNIVCHCFYEKIDKTF